MRKRILNPQMVKSDTLWRVPIPTRYFFVLLWMEADREGRFLWRARYLASTLFPLDPEVTEEVVEGWLEQLLGVESIERYSVGKYDYGVIPNFGKWQQVHPREAKSEYPAPPKIAQDLRQKVSPRPARGKPRARPRPTLGDPRLPVSVSTSVSESVSVSVEEKNKDMSSELVISVTRADIQLVFEHWKTLWQKGPQAQLSPKRYRCIRVAVEKYGLDQVKLALDGFAATPFYRGHNDRGEIFDELTLHLRDPEHVERGLALASTPAQPVDSREAQERAIMASAIKAVSS